ncbi:MAG: Ig-like domain-containing protein [Parabacteroides sp.]|nr:Ig-like domain-containing protein [Parabacteroides sp.]
MRYSSFLCLIFCLLLCACDKEDGKNSVTAIYLDASTVTMKTGDEHQFSIMYEPATALAPICKWSVSPQTDGVTISETGLFKALTAGEYIVQAYTANVTDPRSGAPFMDECKVVVSPSFATQIELSYDSIAMVMGSDTLLSYIMQPVYAEIGDIQWKSSSEEIATVKDGEIKALQVGKCIITAYSTHDPTVNADCMLNVLPPTLERIAFLNPDMVFAGINVTEQLFLIGYPSGAVIPELFWSSSDDNVATINSYGKLITKGVGTCTISAATNDGKFIAMATVEVHPVKLEMISFEENNPIQVAIGSSFEWQSYMIVSPPNATNQNVTIRQISGFDVAALSTDKTTIKGLSEGTAVFQVTAEEGGATALCIVDVVDEVVTKVRVEITLSNWAILGGGFTTANVKCQVYNYNTESILVTGLEVLPSANQTNSNKAYFRYHGYIEPWRSKYWLDSFSNIYNPYYLVYFQYNNKQYTVKVRANIGV